MEAYGKILVGFGIPTLPGDIVIRHGDFVFYSPLGLSLMLSMVLTIALSLVSRK